MKKKTILLLFALLLFTNLSCFLFEDQETEIPAPVIIDNEPFLNTDSTYFLEWPLPPQGYTVEDADNLNVKEVVELYKNYINPNQSQIFSNFRISRSEY